MKKIQAHLTRQIISSNSPEAYAVNKKSSFGERIGEKIQYTLSEALFLVEKGKMDIFLRGKLIPKKDLLKKRITAINKKTSKKTYQQVAKAMVNGFEENFNVKFKQSKLTREEIKKAKKLEKKYLLTVS